jgi:hypothetical protein
MKKTAGAKCNTAARRGTYDAAMEADQQANHEHPMEIEHAPEIHHR